jgi:hypothetical protein
MLLLGVGVRDKDGRGTEESGRAVCCAVQPVLGDRSWLRSDFVRGELGVRNGREETGRAEMSEVCLV